MHVTFLAKAPPAGRGPTWRGGPDSGALTSWRWWAPRSSCTARVATAKTKLNNAYLEGRLDTTATTRNWRTVLALVEAADG